MRIFEIPQKRSVLNLLLPSFSFILQQELILLSLQLSVKNLLLQISLCSQWTYTKQEANTPKELAYHRHKPFSAAKRTGNVNTIVRRVEL